MKRVVNATGVILHTNAGRAPLGPTVLARAQSLLEAYCNLEIDLASGVRGQRDTLVAEPLRQLTGAEGALLANNNAAATLLALHALGANQPAAVSRSQLVEIGGSFRLPDVMAAGGVELMAVGSVNRTTGDDYERAIRAGANLVVLAHRSNFYFTGEYEDARVEDVVGVAHKHGKPVLFDLGSGLLNGALYAGVIPDHEPTVAGLLASGADVVTFSGDKLLGGPQCGIAVGKNEYILKMGSDHLYRAFRPGKETYALLSSVLDAYLAGHEEDIPTYRLLRRRADEVRAVACAVRDAFSAADVAGLSCDVVSDEALVGGGTLPYLRLPTSAAALTYAGLSPHALAAALRRLEPAVLARTSDEGVLLDARSILDDDLPLIKQAATALTSTLSRQEFLS